MKDLLAIARNRNLRLLLSGRFISSIGDWLYQVALSVAVFQYSGGTHNTSRAGFYVGILWIVRLIPALLLASYAGTLASRLGYRRAMISADVARLVVVAVMAVALRPAIWPAIYPMAFLVTALNRLFMPASVGLIPGLVEDKEQRLAANASVMQADSLAAILGSAAGGVVAGLGYINLMLGIDAATFGVSILCLWHLRPRPAPRPAAGEEDLEPGIVNALRFIARRPALLFAAGAMALPEFASGALFVWTVPYSAGSLHLGGAGVGYVYAALAVGYFAGGFVASALGTTLRLDLLLAGSVALGGVAFALFGFWAIGIVALGCALVVGLAETVEFAAYETLLQQSVPEHLIGRAAGTIDGLLFNMVFVGTVVAGPAAALLGIQHAITLTGLLVVLGMGVAFWHLYRNTEGRLTAEQLARIPVFAGVAPAVRRWAVQRLERVEVPAGTTVVRHGEIGDRFYTIARGTVQVDVPDGGIRDLGPGDSFGEIALLHNIPRTATVTTTSACVLWTLSREDFLELQQRADQFRESIWEIAAARLQSGDALTAPASRG